MGNSIIGLGNLPSTAMNKMASFKASVGNAVQNVKFFNNSGSNTLNANPGASLSAAGTFSAASVSSLDGIKLAQGQLTELSHDLLSHEQILKASADKSFQDKINITNKGKAKEAALRATMGNNIEHQSDKNILKVSKNSNHKIKPIEESDTPEMTRKMLQDNEEYNAVYKAASDIFDNMRALEEFSNQSCFQFGSLKNEAEQKQFDAMSGRKTPGQASQADNSRPSPMKLAFKG